MTHHRDRRLDTKALLNHSLEVRHLIEILKGHRSVRLARADTILLFTDFGKNVRVVGEMLESIDQAAAHSVLASE
jgi:hypothetical protein